MSTSSWLLHIQNELRPWDTEGALDFSYIADMSFEPDMHVFELDKTDLEDASYKEHLKIKYYAVLSPLLKFYFKDSSWV